MDPEMHRGKEAARRRSHRILSGNRRCPEEMNPRYSIERRGLSTSLPGLNDPNEHNDPNEPNELNDLSGVTEMMKNRMSLFLWGSSGADGLQVQ